MLKAIPEELSQIHGSGKPCFFFEWVLGHSHVLQGRILGRCFRQVLFSLFLTAKLHERR